MSIWTERFELRSQTFLGEMADNSLRLSESPEAWVPLPAVTVVVPL